MLIIVNHQIKLKQYQFQSEDNHVHSQHLDLNTIILCIKGTIYN